MTTVTDTGQLGDKFLGIWEMLLLVAMLDQQVVSPALTRLVVNLVTLASVLGSVCPDPVGLFFEARLSFLSVLDRQLEPC